MHSSLPDSPAIPYPAIPVEIIPKPWGVCQRLINSQFIRVEQIEIVPGGYSSIHCHWQQDNDFFVLEGELCVVCYDLPGIAKALDVPAFTAGGGLQEPRKMLGLSGKNFPMDAKQFERSGKRYSVSAGQSFTAIAGRWHRFEVGGSPVKAVEIYRSPRPGRVSPDDIIRITENGVAGNDRDPN